MTTAIPFYTPSARVMLEKEELEHKNFGLSEARFEAMLDDLERGDEALFERIFVSQFWRRVRLLQSTHRAPQADAEDAVMNALLEFRKLLIARKVTYGNLEAYFTRIIVTGYQKKQKRTREISVDTFSEALADEIDVPDFTTEELAAFKKAWDSLCEKCSAVLKGFYYDELPHQRIADLLGKRVDAVKQDKHRCIEKLRKHFFEYL
jgi:RNA polymerase sigma factor (sigma-70 family)